MASTTVFTNTTHHHFSMVWLKTLWQLHFGYGYIVHAGGGVAGGAYKMYMVIVVVAGFAMVFAKSITNGIIVGGYGMYQALIYKNLQGAVNGYPVHFVANRFFYSTMVKGTCMVNKKAENFFPAVGHTQVVTL